MNKKIIYLGFAIILIISGCTNSVGNNNLENEQEISETEREKDMVIIAERTEMIMTKVDNEQSVEAIVKVFDYNRIPSFCLAVSAPQELGYINPDDVECIRMSDDKEYIYIPYKVSYDEKVYIAFGFYKKYKNKYFTDSLLVLNDENNLSIVKSYTLNDLLKVDKDFIENLENEG